MKGNLMPKTTKEDWFNVASICSEWIWEAVDDRKGKDSGLWRYYQKACGEIGWNLYRETLDQAARIINPAQPFNVTVENEMFVALQIACEKAGLCR
jgi:hypothetical protein